MSSNSRFRAIQAKVNRGAKGFTLPAWAKAKDPKPKTETLNAALTRSGEQVSIGGFVRPDGTKVDLKDASPHQRAIAHGIEVCEQIEWGLLSKETIAHAELLEAHENDRPPRPQLHLHAEEAIFDELLVLREEFYPHIDVVTFGSLFSLWRWKVRNGNTWSEMNGPPIPVETVNDLVRWHFGERPLIDKLQEATFGNNTGMQWLAEPYDLRATYLRKAHRFSLNAETSALIADFSIAIAPDLDAARQLAIPPFRTTWIDIDNRARIQRLSDRNIKLTTTASNIQNVVDRVGWLITTHPTSEGDRYCATYCTDLNSASGIFLSPLAFWWMATQHDIRKDIPASNRPDDRLRTSKILDRYLFGLVQSNVSIERIAFGAAPYMKQDEDIDDKQFDFALSQMNEIAGELRHIFGFLVALNCSHTGVEATIGEGRKYDGPALSGGGKPLFPLEYKTLTIKLAKRATVERAVLKATAHIRKKRHEVRGHVRTLHKPNPDGTPRRVPVKPHWRGDERLGKIEKNYKVERS